MSKTLPVFLTAYGTRKECVTPSGEEIENTYGYVMNDKGQKELQITGKENKWEKIQEHLEDTKLENILARVAMGDTTVFRPEGIYEDITKAPKNLMEAQNMMIKLQNTWESLPLEIRKKYDNSVETFMAKSNTEEWLYDMGYKERPIETPKQVETPKETKGESET